MRKLLLILELGAFVALFALLAEHAPQTYLFKSVITALSGV